MPKKLFSLVVLISKDDVIHHLVSVIPCVKLFLQRAVRKLRGVRVCVCERQARHGVRECVRVEGVRHVGVATVHAIHCIEHAAHQEAVAVATPPETSAKGSYRLKVSGMEVDEQDDFLVEALRVQSGVEQPEAGLIDCKLHLKNQIMRWKQLQSCNKCVYLFFIFSLRPRSGSI